MSATTEPTTTPAPTAVTTPAKEPGQLTKETYRGRIHPDWCPGCGDFSVLAALQTALFELGLQPHQVCVISGIGCSSNLPGYVNTYGMHTLHGRALAVATGLRCGNHDLKVICTGGDGDGYGIGGNHFVHMMRRNVDLTYIVMDNQIYGLTTGQCSPTSVKGMKTKSTPHGSVENPINPIPMAIVGGATYVARAFSGKQKHMVEMFKGAIQHKGCALVDAMSPPVLCLLALEPRVAVRFLATPSHCVALLVRRFRRHRSKFLETRIVPERIEHWIEPEQRRSKRQVRSQWARVRYRE